MSTERNTYQQEIRFDGQTFNPRLDFSRLARQSVRVFELMKDGAWRTLREISDATEDPEASVSARLRDFRKMGCTVERRRRGSEMSGLHEYRLVLGE